LHVFGDELRTRRVDRRLRRPRPALDLLRRNLAVKLLDPLLDLVGLEVARNNDDSVVGRVELPVKLDALGEIPEEE
jgi:hypothetical protein